MTHSKKFSLEESFTDLSRKAESWEISEPMPSSAPDKPTDKKSKTHYTYPSLYLREVPVPDVPVGEEIVVRAKVRVSEKTERETEKGKMCTMDVEFIGIEWPKEVELEEPYGDEEMDRDLDAAMKSTSKDSEDEREDEY